MPTGDLIRGLLFVGSMGLVYALAAWFLLQTVRKRPSPTTGMSWLRRAVFTLAIAGLLCAAYGYFIEPYWPEVTRVQIVSAKLSPGVRLRVVQISDLHSDDEERLEPRLPRLIARQQPDLIVYTGDTANSAAGLARTRRMFNRLAAIAPVYAVRGNWDEADVFAGAAVRELNGNIVELNLSGNRIRIAGVGSENGSALPRILGPIAPDEFLLALSHRPDQIESVAALHNVDLYCAGHTHGGQIALPLYGAIITLTRLGKKYESGLYRVQQTYLYVNRGIGMENRMPPVRFCTRPEITVIDIFGGAPQP